MREVEQVCAELKGRVGLDPKYVVAIKAVYADEEAVDAGDWDMVVSAAAGLEGVLLEPRFAGRRFAGAQPLQEYPDKLLRQAGNGEDRQGGGQHQHISQRRAGAYYYYT